MISQQMLAFLAVSESEIITLSIESVILSKEF
jgi:hypothetical protein